VIVIYKGYLKGNGKHAATSFKDGSKLLSYNTARKEESYVGILADDFIMVDVDDIDEAEVLLDIVEDKNINCSVLQTNNGMHFYFKGYDLTANKIKWYSNIGIHCDYKLGIKNTADPLKINGHIRKWLRKCEEHDPLPAWLYPYNKKNPNLTKLSDGDGRNDKLFTYILKMQSQGMAKKDIKETIAIINSYILEQPVDKSELNIILRDDAFMKESFFIKGVFHHDKFGDFLINEHHICKIANVLHIYHDGVYSDHEEDIERMMVKHISSLTRARRQETLAYIQLNAKEKQFASTQYIVMKNGVFVQDKKIRAMLEEILGYILFRRNEFAATFILTGDGSNGKSSYLKIIRRLVGQDNAASLDLKELDQRFKTAELFGKLVNIGDDIAKGYIKDSSVFNVKH